MYYVSEKEIEELDRLAVKSGLAITQMMELAGKHMVTLFEILKIPRDSSVTIVCGKGNKGGDGLSAARHLVNNGWKVDIILLSKDISKEAEHELDLVKKMKLPLYMIGSTEVEKSIKVSNVVIDSLIGYHLDGAPRDAFADAIEQINKAEGTIISYDIPTGVDSTTGECLGTCVEADVTLSLAIAKKGLTGVQGIIYC
tara:strand:- start:243 stop:836 length:594 start_codon:yes stop_codon:yes gene_type:complete